MSSLVTVKRLPELSGVENCGKALNCDVFKNLYTYFPSKCSISLFTVMVLLCCQQAYMLEGQMVWLRCHAVCTVEYEYFTPSLGCVKRKSWSIYKWKGATYISDCLIHHWNTISDCRNSVFSHLLVSFSGVVLSWSRLVIGSEFSSHGQLLYGPCMSSLTAAVFTSRLDWYGQTSCCPATVSSPLLLSSHPYDTRFWTTRPLERFKHLDCVEVVTGSSILLLSTFCGLLLKTLPCVYVM